MKSAFTVELTYQIYMMFWKYTFCYLVAIYISNAVVFSKEKILQRGPSERLQYAIFKNDLFHALDGTRIEVGYVETAKHCLVNCVKSLQCFSANIGVHLGKMGRCYVNFFLRINTVRRKAFI